MPIIKIEQWSVKPEPSNGYTAPEMLRNCLHGHVAWHPRRPKGGRILTSPIIKAEGRIITTHSGTVYELGEVDPKYLLYLREQLGRELGNELDPTQPIVVKSR